MEPSPAPKPSLAVPGLPAVAVPNGCGSHPDPVSEVNTPALRQPLTCLRCGHVTPYVEGWMVAAAMHHIAAVHGSDAATLERH